MKVYEFQENQIFIKNQNNLKRSIVVLATAVVVAALIIYFFNPVINRDLLFSRPTLTFHLPLFFVLVLFVMIIMSFNYKLFDGDKKTLYQHTIFGTKPLCSFDEIDTIKRVDVYNRTVHSRVKYEIIRAGNKYGNGILLDSFFPSESLKIKDFEENVIPKINQLIHN